MNLLIYFILCNVIAVIHINVLYVVEERISKYVMMNNTRKDIRINIKIIPYH